MKILMYASIFSPTIGGPATQCANLCSALKERGHEPIVLTIGERFECTMQDGYKIYRYPWRYTGTPIDKLIRWIVFPGYFVRVVRREKPDVVNCHSVSVLSLLVGLMTRVLRVPSVMKFSGDWVWETLSTHKMREKDFDAIYRHSVLSRLMLMVERLGLKNFDMIWVPSQFRLDNITGIFGREPENFRLIYNSLDLPADGYTERRGSASLTIVSASRFIPHKRIPFLIRAFAAMDDKKAHLVLIGAGDAAHEREARTAVNDAGVAGRVTFPGRLLPRDVYLYFREADVYISTSVEEGFPNVFIEAMNFGLPIVSAKIGGCGELVAEGETGFLVEADDEVGFTDRLNELARDVRLRNRMAVNAFERSKKFSLKETIVAFEEMYAAAINAK